jgi:hypothetical protein
VQTPHATAISLPSTMSSGSSDTVIAHGLALPMSDGKGAVSKIERDLEAQPPLLAPRLICRKIMTYLHRSRNQLGSCLGSLTAFYEDRWVWELLGSCLAVSCLVAIIAILATSQDTPLSEQGSLSINAWISIFTTVMKAAIMMVVAEGMLSIVLVVT